MVDRRGLILGGLGAGALAAGGCAKLGKLSQLGQAGLNNAGKPWSYARGGRQERFEIRAGDHWKGEHSERSEVAIYRFVRPHADVWQSFGMLVEPGPVSQVPWLILGQWHAYKDPWDGYVSPPLAQLLVGDAFRIWTASDPHLRTTPQAYPPQIVRYERPHFERGRWHHFVYRTRFNPFGRARLQVWIDGQQAVDLENASIGYNDVIGPYFKYGVYRPPGDPRPVAARYSNMELSYESLADRIARPLSP